MATSSLEKRLAALENETAACDRPSTSIESLEFEQQIRELEARLDQYLEDDMETYSAQEFRSRAH